MEFQLQNRVYKIDDGDLFIDTGKLIHFVPTDDSKRRMVYSDKFSYREVVVPPTDTLIHVINNSVVHHRDKYKIYVYMANAVRKRPIIIETDDEDLDDLIGNSAPIEREPTIDELLSDVELPDPSKKLKVEPGEIGAPRRPRIVAVKNDFPIGYFRTKKGQEIIAPVQRYWVVKDADGKLWYKEESGVTFLPEDWQPGDKIPGWSDEEQPISKEDLDDLL